MSNNYKKIIFLDIDGVLASIPYLCKGKGFIDPSKCKLLSQLEDIGAEVVISSSWGYDNFTVIPVIDIIHFRNISRTNFCFKSPDKIHLHIIIYHITTHIVCDSISNGNVSVKVALINPES